MIRKFILIACCIGTQFSKASDLLVQEMKRARDENSVDEESLSFIASKKGLFQTIVLGRSWNIEMEANDCSPNGRFALLHSELHDLKTFPPSSSVSLAEVNNFLCASAFSSDSQLLVTASKDNQGTTRLYLWDLSNFPHLEKPALLGSKERVISLKFKPHSQSLLVHCENGNLSILHFHSKAGQLVTLEKRLATVKNNTVSLAEFNYLGTILVLGYNNGELQMFDLTKDEPELIALTKNRHAACVTNIAFSLDHRMIITTAEEVSLDDGEDYIAPTFAWNIRNLQPITPVEFPTNMMPVAPRKSVRTTKISRNYQGALTVWDVLHLPEGMQAQLNYLTSSNFLEDSILLEPFKQPRLSDILCFTELVSTKQSENDGEEDELAATRLNGLPKTLKAVAQMMLRKNKSSNTLLVN